MIKNEESLTVNIFLPCSLTLMLKSRQSKSLKRGLLGLHWSKMSESLPDLTATPHTQEALPLLQGTVKTCTYKIQRNEHFTHICLPPKRSVAKM